jgi:glutamine amidotransferase
LAGERIGILRMPIGNLQSVWNALYELGADPAFVDERADYRPLSHLVIPGVGNFRAVMSHLEARGLPALIREFAASGRPVLGICAGMQLLARTGTEGGDTAGLSLIDGRVERLPEDAGMRLPHVGWSTVRVRRPHPVFEGLKQDRDFYFVHSYAMHVARESDWLGETSYGGPFVSVVGSGNVVGMQFHPEKSQVNGLRLLENFLHWDGRC